VTLVWISAVKEQYSLFGAAAAVAIQSCLPFTALAVKTQKLLPLMIL